MSVSDRMTPEGEKFMKELRELAKLEVAVGFQRGKHKRETSEKKKEPDMLDVAMWNEYGTSRGIPSRPFMRQSFDKNEDDLGKTAEAGISLIIKGATAKKVLSIVGEKAVGFMQKEIKDGGFVPNADKTVKQKKSDQPLINTAQMRQSLHEHAKEHFIVRQKGEGEK